MIINRTNTFKKGYKKLHPDIQKITDRKLLLFEKNPSHPSLAVKKMKGTKDIFEAKITDNYRFTFCIQEGVYILRYIGTHNILKKE